MQRCPSSRPCELQTALSPKRIALVHLIVVAVLASVSPLTIDAQDDFVSPVKADTRFSFSPFPARHDRSELEAVEEGDEASRISDLLVIGDWLVVTMFSGTASIPNEPVWWMPWDWNERNDRLIALNLSTGERRNIVVNNEFFEEEVHFAKPYYLDEDSIEFELCRFSTVDDEEVPSDVRLATMQWNLTTDEFNRKAGEDHASSRKMTWTEHIVDSVGLSLESVDRDTMLIKDATTERTMTLSYASEHFRYLSDIGKHPFLPANYIVPGRQDQRLCIYSSPVGDDPMITAYDPDCEGEYVWRVFASAIEERCAKRDCIALFPAANMRYPAERLPVMAIFESSPPSFVSLMNDGTFEWSCEIPDFDAWAFTVVSENERFVAVIDDNFPWNSLVLVDCDSQSMSTPFFDELYTNLGVQGVMNDGRIVLAYGLTVDVFCYDSKWNLVESFDFSAQPE